MPSFRLCRSSLGQAVVAAMLLTAGCASTGALPAQHPPQPGHTPAAQNWLTVRVERGAASGKTVHVKVGDRIALILGSQYWIIRGSSAPAVVHQEGHTTTLPPSPQSCPPGVGCRPLRAIFAAQTPGTAVITAHRTTCGEAIRCVGSQGHYRLTVIVTAR